MTKPPKLRQSSPKSAPVSRFARELLREWRQMKLADQGQAVVVAVSGGADSVALLLALDELVRAGKVNQKLLIAHLNHGLRGADSNGDARWVQSLAKEMGYRSIVSKSDIKRRAGKDRDNLEQAARQARYRFLKKAATSHKARLVVTAHTMNDQAETILMNLIRGSGNAGLRGIEPVRPLESDSQIVLARPLLSWARRADTEGFCRSKGIDYREDAMNADARFSRVRVRKELLPLLETFNPRFIDSIARSAAIVREDNLALETAAGRLLALAAQDRNLRVDLLLVAPAALRRRALRQWLAQHRGDLRRIEHAHIVAIEKLLKSPKSGRAVELPGGANAYRKGGMLHYRG